MLLENVPLTQFIGCTSYGQTKIQLQLWNYKTSCTQLLVPIGYLHDGLKHIPPWFKPQLQLAQQAPWFVHQLLLHPKWNLVWFTNFQHLHKITIKKTNSYCIIFCNRLQISKEHFKKHANEVPKHQCNDYFVYSDKYIHHDQDFCSRSWYCCM